MTYSTRTTCRLCDSKALRQVLDLGHTALANDYPVLQDGEMPAEKQDLYPLYIVQCGDCRHVQCPVVVDPALLFTEYSYTSGTSKAFREHLLSFAHNELTSGDSIVDIGSNDGSLVRACLAEGMRAIGVDPARNLAAEASDGGALTIPAFFTAKLARSLKVLMDGPADYVTALNVFAHADNLGEIADGVRILIGERGQFVFEVAYLLDLLKKNEFGSCYHEHLSHHHVGALEPFLRRHGLCLTAVERIDIQGGSIRCYAAEDIGQPIPPWIQAMIDVENDELPALLKAWPHRIQAQMQRDRVVVAPYIGKGLCVYGAPARSGPYLAQLGLQRDDVECVFDDEPRKIGRYMPGVQWPIVASSEFRKRNPSAVLVMSWNYIDDIKARFPDYQGRWILPDRSEA
jgi:hypothetical protein